MKRMAARCLVLCCSSLLAFTGASCGGGSSGDDVVTPSLSNDTAAPDENETNGASGTAAATTPTSPSPESASLPTEPVAASTTVATTMATTTTTAAPTVAPDPCPVGVWRAAANDLWGHVGASTGTQITADGTLQLTVDSAGAMEYDYQGVVLRLPADIALAVDGPVTAQYTIADDLITARDLVSNAHVVATVGGQPMPGVDAQFQSVVSGFVEQPAQFACRNGNLVFHLEPGGAVPPFDLTFQPA